MPFRVFDAVIWTAGVTLAFIFLVSLVIAATGSASDVVLLGGVQLLVYVAACAVFAWQRQGKSFSELFALRPTSPWLLAFAVLLGPALHGPDQTLSRLIDMISPLQGAELQARLDQLTPHGALHGVVLFAIVALAAPFVEELLYRGALFTALRPAHAAAGAVWVSALCFAMAHMNARDGLRILVLALVLSVARAQSGSLWVSYLAHAAFNATSLAVVFWARDDADVVPLPYEVLGWVLSVLLLAGVMLVARRSSRAGQARMIDLSLVPERGREA